MNLSTKRGVLVGAKWISFCACFVISFLAFGMAFLIPGDSVLVRVWHTGFFVVLLGLAGVGSGYLFRATENEPRGLWSTPPLRLFAVISVCILIGFPLVWFVLK
jgi:hypothetical protein